MPRADARIPDRNEPVAPAALSRHSIMKVNLAAETDVVLARQRAKQIAGLVGFDLQDQTRVATAVSEIARNAWEYGKGGQVEFSLEPPRSSGESGLRVVVTDQGKGITQLEAILNGTYHSPTGMGVGLSGARRLVDDLDIETGGTGTRITLIKLLPRHAPRTPSLNEITAALTRTAPAERATTHALHEQNQELLTLLGELRARETELEALNVELEETNRGVLVLYAELADKAQAVQEASEMKTRFLSGVTHELRTPLNSIVSLARLMQAQVDGPLNGEQEKQVLFILRSAQNLSEMVNDLLDLAKIEAGKSNIVTSDFTVQALFSGLRGMFRPLATNPNVKLIVEAPESTIELSTDEGKLSQILRNFISNALKFTEQGTITVSAEPVADDPARRLIRFSVVDTGVGIAPENHALVMQEWGQVASSKGSGAKGSGLGLPLSRSLAELLGGSLDFTSAPGEGSHFYVTLPALARAEPANRPADQSGEPSHILMVDDDEVSRYLLRRQLGTLTSAPIEEAASGDEALRAIAMHPPRLIFLDLVMPGLSGAEVARRLRSQPATASLPIVLHTSKTLNAEDERTLEAFDLTYIPKRPAGGHSPESDDEQRAAMERALLEVGLSNLHIEPSGGAAR
jgi:signal transduction histidine kinase